MKITYENLEFPSDIKTKITKKLNASIKVEFINGKKIMFKGFNIGLEQPNKIIFSSKATYLEMIVYEDDNLFYNKDLSNPISLNKLLSIVNNMK